MSIDLRQIRILTWKLISGFIVQIWQIQHSTNSTPSRQINIQYMGLVETQTFDRRTARSRSEPL